MNYFEKVIELNEPGAHTLAIMDWIKANDCPNLDCTIFYNAGHYEGIVSKIIGGIEEPSKYKNAFEYNGMKRVHDAFCFFFFIDGNEYYMTY